MSAPPLPLPPVEFRPAAELGTTHAGRLLGRHHFCFATYQRPDRIEWGALRALHDYQLEAGAARAPSLHAGFEILTLVLDGRLRRTGTFQTRDLMEAGSAELISTGSGVQLGLDSVGPRAAHYLEIWVRSASPAGKAQRQYRRAAPVGLGRAIASDASPGGAGLIWNARGAVHEEVLAAGAPATCVVRDGELGYLALRSGTLQVGDLTLQGGDAVAATGPCHLPALATAPATLLWIRVPPIDAV